MIIPALAGRNPFPLVALLIVVVVVRSAWAPALARDTGWALIVRLAVIASVISVIFNVLTAPFGDQVLLQLPGWWPLGDVVTANALVFGLLSAIAIVVIILAGTTVGSLADWPALLRSVPARFLSLAVAGSVAWAFVPQTIGTLRDIRDAQRVRGITVASARTLVPIIVPLLATSLERATTMAEALEARGFGGSAALPQRGVGRASLLPIAAPIGLTLLIAGAYLLLDGSPEVGAGLTVTGGGLIAMTLAGSGRDPRSRYRRRVWRRRDTAVLVTSLLSLSVTGLSLIGTSRGLRYSPYPGISLPVVDIPLILALGLLLAPAVVAPQVPVRRESIRAALHSDELETRDSQDTLRVLSASSPGVGGRILRSPTARPVPWASWPPAFRSGRVPRHRRLRSVAVVEKGFALVD